MRRVRPATAHPAGLAGLAGACLVGGTLLVGPLASPAVATVDECDPGVEQLVPTRPSALAALGAERAWEHATGDGVVVAVVDSGVDTDNVHLTGAAHGGTDLVDPEGRDEGRTDTAGHGTAIAGQIAAREVSGSGVVGLAPEATVLPVRVYVEDTDRGRADGTAPTTERMAEGIRHATENGARVINVSLSSTTDDPELRAAVTAATERGALVVASAGNRNTTQATEDSPRYPAAYPGVLGVAAVDAGDQVTDDSIHGEHVDVAAPGTDVLTTFHAAGDCVLGGAVSPSFATAYVSAAAALVAEAYPAETPDQWAYRLMVTASRTQVGARDDLVGWGVVRPAEALIFVDDGTAPGPPSPLHARVEVPRPDSEPVALSAREDVLGGAQETSSWWLLGAGVAVLGSVLAAQLRRRGRSPSSSGR